jgi:hypothetical protein
MAKNHLVETFEACAGIKTTQAVGRSGSPCHGGQALPKVPSLPI